MERQTAANSIMGTDAFSFIKNTVNGIHKINATNPLLLPETASGVVVPFKTQIALTENNIPVIITPYLESHVSKRLYLLIEISDMISNPCLYPLKTPLTRKMK